MSWPPIELDAPLERLLTTGSDNRLAVDPSTKLNIYGCAPIPRPAVISFASTTASSISPKAYERAERARASLLRTRRSGDGVRAFDDTFAQLGVELKSAFGIDDPGVEIVFSASGTDAQLQALFIAQACHGSPMTSIIVAADEAGSGTAYTSLGQHFNAITAHGASVAKGEVVAGIGCGVKRVNIHVRDERGAVRSMADVDAGVMAAVAAAHAAGRKVFLLAMDQSKSGVGGPSPACLQQIAERWSKSVQIVIDGCQGRLASERLRQHLDDGHIVLVTGSKFFTGPPFSGAMFVPPALSDRLNRVREVPAGLLDYSGQSEWPRRWANIRTRFRAHMNFGLWLRWEAALAEIGAYNAVPRAFRTSMLARFADAVPEVIAEFDGCELVELAHTTCSVKASHTEGVIRTIYPFYFRHRGRRLRIAEARGIYAALNRDLSDALPTGASDHVRRVAATLCHIGQPFPMMDRDGCEVGALRISADARLVSDAWDGVDETASINRFDHTIAQLRIVLEKIHVALSLSPTAEDYAKCLPF